MNKKISFISLILLIIGSIDNIRNLPSSALFGSSSIFFFLFGAVLFLIPTALVAAELASAFPQGGGVYHWMKRALGEKMGVCAVWLQWINTMVWYPTILSFIAGSIAYLINPALAASPLYILCVVVVLFWTLTGINFFGIRTSARVNSLCGLIGTIFPLLLLIGLGAFWVIRGEPLQINFTSAEILPSLETSATWVSLISVMASFLGMELCGVHVNEIERPNRNFPKAVLIAAAFILFSMLFGSLAIALILPKGDINLVSGVLQVFSSLFAHLHLSWCTPFLALLIIIGSIGNMVNWLISPAKGLFFASKDGFLPPFLTKTNRFGAPSRILIIQAILVSVFASFLFLVPSINAFYWFLTALSTGLYMMMYILLFMGALKLHYSYKERPSSFKIPFGTVGIWVISSLGLIGCLVTLVIGFLSPEALMIQSKARYAALIGCGNLIMIAPVFLFFLYKKRKKAKEEMEKLCFRDC